MFNIVRSLSTVFDLLSWSPPPSSPCPPSLHGSPGTTAAAGRGRHHPGPRPGRGPQNPRRAHRVAGENLAQLAVISRGFTGESHWEKPWFNNIKDLHIFGISNRFFWFSWDLNINKKLHFQTWSLIWWFHFVWFVGIYQINSMVQ